MSYEKDRNEQITNLGFDPTKLADFQKDILLQPIEAPENYHHDGEVSAIDARNIWEGKMKKAGFTTLQLFNLRKKMKL